MRSILMLRFSLILCWLRPSASRAYSGDRFPNIALCARTECMCAHLYARSSPHFMRTMPPYTRTGKKAAYRSVHSLYFSFCFFFGAFDMKKLLFPQVDGTEIVGQRFLLEVWSI